MAGRCAGWTMLVLLGAGAVTCAAQSAVNIDLIELSNKTDPASLTVCASEDLVDGDVTLVIGQTGLPTTNYPAASVGGQCANFTGAFVAPSQEQEIGVELNVLDLETNEVNQTGSVTFNFSVTAVEVRCDADFNFVRYAIIDGTFADGICLPGQVDPLVCYTSADDPRVCVNGLNDDNENFQVCLTQTDAVSTYPAGFLNVSSLNYADCSISITNPGGSDVTLRELIVKNISADTTSASSCQDTCPIVGFTPSTDSYDFCALFQATDGTFSSAFTTFQDYNLLVDSTTPYLDFHLTNKYTEVMKYQVYTGNDSTTITSGTPVSLDCSRLILDVPCYGFVDAGPQFLAVEYGDGTNTIVAPTTTVSNDKLA